MARATAGAADGAAPQGKAQNDALQDFLSLHCNYLVNEGSEVCGKVLEEAWATSCSHIFCTEHAQAWFQKDDRCPICLDQCGAVRMAKVQTSTKEQTRVQKLLLGRCPSDIQLAASTAMNFWLEQKMTELDRQRRGEYELQDKVKRTIGGGRRRLTEADAMVKSLTAGTEELRRQLHESEGRLHRGREEIERLRSRCEQVREAYKEALGRAAGLSCRSTPRPRRGGNLLLFSQSATDDLAFHLQRSTTSGNRSRSPRCEAGGGGAVGAGDGSYAERWQR